MMCSGVVHTTKSYQTFHKKLSFAFPFTSTPTLPNFGETFFSYFKLQSRRINGEGILQARFSFAIARSLALLEEFAYTNTPNLD